MRKITANDAITPSHDNHSKNGIDSNVFQFNNNPSPYTVSHHPNANIVNQSN
jgi:hypothetical protein